jgi:hypothetical protein
MLATLVSLAFLPKRFCLNRYTIIITIFYATPFDQKISTK